MNEPDKPKLTDYLTEALAKSLTEEGCQSLLEERELVEAEAQRERLEALRIQMRPLDTPEVGEEAQTPPEVRPESRPDPILPVAVSVREHPAREAGRLAFGGIVDLDQDLPADGQLPLLPAPEGPRVPLLELVDRYGVPTMAQGRGAPLELAVYIGACILTPHRVRVSRGRLVTTVRELRDFLFGPIWHPSPTGNRPGDWERVRATALNASDLWRAVAVRKIPPAAGRYPPTPPPQPERPPVELRPRALPRSDGGGPATAGVRVRRQEEPDAGQPGRRMGGPGWGRDPDPNGHHPG